jgi:DNA-binding transcriptional regulator GbsR (MarR family)
MEQERYVEDFGLFFEPYGSRIMGRVLGVLFVSDPPERSAEELINLLKSSQGSISQATRALERLGWIQRLTRPGDRRAYFRVRPGAWQETARQSILGIARFREMAERALDLQDSKDPEARRALEKMRDFYVYWEKEMIALLERWNGG